MVGEPAQELGEAAAAMAVTPAQGDAQEGMALPVARARSLEAVAAKSERPALGQQQPACSLCRSTISDRRRYWAGDASQS